MPKVKAIKKSTRSRGRLKLDDLRLHRSKKAVNDKSLQTQVMNKLNELMTEGKNEDALTLFTEILSGGWVPVPNSWKLGAELIGRTSPERLADYLKAVHVNAPPDLLVPTFTAYIDHLMLGKKWKTVIDEIQLVQSKKPYADVPDFRRKLALCSYNQWSLMHQARLDRDTDDDEDSDEKTQNAEYKRLTSTTAHLLEAVHMSFKTDVEILDMYLKILEATGNTFEMQQVITDSLKLLDDESVDVYFILYLMKINENEKFFSSKPHILFLYENVPYLETSESFEKYARYTCRRLVKAMTKNGTTEEREKFGERVKRLFLILITRLEHCKFEPWLLEELRKSLFEYLLDEEVYELYEECRVYQLLRSAIAKLQGEEKTRAQSIATDLELVIEEYELQSNREPNPEDISLRLFKEVKNHLTVE